MQEFLCQLGPAQAARKHVYLWPQFLQLCTFTYIPNHVCQFLVVTSHLVLLDAPFQEGHASRTEPGAGGLCRRPFRPGSGRWFLAARPRPSANLRPLGGRAVASVGDVPAHLPPRCMQLQRQPVSESEARQDETGMGGWLAGVAKAVEGYFATRELRLGWHLVLPADC